MSSKNCVMVGTGGKNTAISWWSGPEEMAAAVAVDVATVCGAVVSVISLVELGGAPWPWLAAEDDAAYKDAPAMTAITARAMAVVVLETPRLGLTEPNLSPALFKA